MPISSFFRPWKAACRPFIHRSFRGRLWQRALLGSAVWAALSVCTSIWIALGAGALERDFRVELGFEEPLWTRQQLDFLHVVESDVAEQEAVEARALLRRDVTTHHDVELQYTIHALQGMREEGRRVLRGALLLPPPEEHLDLARRASNLLERTQSMTWEVSPYEYVPPFDWSTEGDIRRLRSIVDADLLPHIERYASPLEHRDAFALVGLFSGGFFLLACLVLAPLFAGIQIAQEVHENTLQPLAGTALSERQLAVGLSSAPLARAAIFGAPHLLVVLLCAPVAHHKIALPLGLGVAVVVGVWLTMMAQLAGLAMGRRRAPGVVAMTLMAVLGMASFVALLVGVNLNHEDAMGLVAIIPQEGPIVALIAAFSPNHAVLELDLTRLHVHLVGVATAFAALLALATLAFERRLSTRTQASLTAVEHATAATIVTFLGLTALPLHEIHFTRGGDFVALAIVYPALLLLLVARVPIGERYGAGLELRWHELVVPYVVGLLVHAVALGVAVGDVPYVGMTGPAAAHLAWILVMGFLVAVCAVSRPMTVGRSIRALLAIVMIVLECVTFMFAVEHRSDASYLPTLEFSALLGVLQLGLLLVLPLGFLRDLGWLSRSRSPS